MRKHTEPQPSIGPCLSEADFYNFVTGSKGERPDEDLEFHLIRCDACREQLAGLLEILDGNDEEDLEAIPPVSEEEIQETLALVQHARKAPASPRRVPSWRQWAMAAAALIVLVGLSALLVHNYFERKKSGDFYNQARAALEAAYVPVSPNGLRLELPFSSSGSDQRAPADEAALNRAENFFYQALAVREDMMEAHLGLALVYLNKARFSSARFEFQKVLSLGSPNPRALLGRGVTLCEEGLASRDPLERKTRLESALADFDAVLKIDQASREAQYNKALTLYEMGRHREALAEIDRYLSRDPGSIWSQRLRNIQLKIRATRSEFVDKEVNRAALAHDLSALERLATVAPYQIPDAIRGVLKNSLDARFHEGQSTGSASLIWSARTLEAAYGTVTGDRSYKRLLDFYGGLSPPERKKKNLLDSRMENLVDLHRKGNYETALRNTPLIAREYQTLGDYWQLVNLYHLRGNSFYYSNADFRSAAREYRKMLRCAEHAGAPDLIARALASQASIYNEEQEYDDALACLNRMQEVARKYRLDPWDAYAHQYLGQAYLMLNQGEASLKEYASALALGCRLGEEQLVVVSLENLGAVLEQLGRDRDASRFFGLALQAHDEYSAPRGGDKTPAEMVRTVNILCKLGYLSLRMKNLAAAQTHFLAALKTVPRGARELETRIRIGLAQAFIEARDFESAGRELTLTRSVAASGEFPDLAWQLHYLNGVLQQQSGANAGARAHFQEAIRILEGMRQGITSEELRQAFLTRRFDPYRETVSLLCGSQDKQGALQFVERSKSMTLTERLVSRQRNPSPRLPRITRPVMAFPEGLAVLEYFFLSDRLLVFISSKDRLDMLSLEVPRFRVDDQVRQYAESIRSEGIESFNSLSRALYDQLLAPALKLLPPRGVHTLLILPDGPLYKLPFAGLQDSEGRYLLEKFALSYAPSRSVFRYCLSLNRGTAASREHTILLLDGTDGLRGASEELAYLAGIYRARATLIGPGQVNAIKEKAAEVEILHFSGHAAPSGGKPRLLFPSLPRPRYLEASTISSWSLPHNRLVYLAGCNTGIGPAFEGEAPWGLLPAFFSAGAPAVVCSLLPVEDREARDLTLRFYAELTRGSSKARALQVAQLSMIKDLKTQAYRHPRSWLPFVLVGDPR